MSSLYSRLFVIGIVLSIFSSVAFSQMPAKRNHEVPLDSAKKFIANFAKDSAKAKVKAVMFSREVFDKILSQKGCVGLRYYFAKTNDGTQTLVAVGVDSLGNDMTNNAAVAETAFPCPPYCDQKSSLAK